MARKTWRPKAQKRADGDRLEHRKDIPRTQEGDGQTKEQVDEQLSVGEASRSNPSTSTWDEDGFEVTGAVMKGDNLKRSASSPSAHSGDGVGGSTSAPASLVMTIEVKGSSSHLSSSTSRCFPPSPRQIVLIPQNPEPSSTAVSKDASQPSEKAQGKQRAVDLIALLQRPDDRLTVRSSEPLEGLFSDSSLTSLPSSRMPAPELATPSEESFDPDAPLMNRYLASSQADLIEPIGALTARHDVGAPYKWPSSPPASAEASSYRSAPKTRSLSASLMDYFQSLPSSPSSHTVPRETHNMSVPFSTQSPIAKPIETQSAMTCLPQPESYASLLELKMEDMYNRLGKWRKMGIEIAEHHRAATLASFASMDEEDTYDTEAYVCPEEVVAVRTRCLMSLREEDRLDELLIAIAEGEPSISDLPSTRRIRKTSRLEMIDWQADDGEDGGI